MPTNLNFGEILEYTDWERQKWHDWFKKHGDDALNTSAGPHGDGRFQTVGAIIKHIFSAEKRYVDRLSDRPITETASLTEKDSEQLFQFGRQSRAEFLNFLQTFPSDKWDVTSEFRLQNNFLRVTPRKIAIHVVLHEIRHWAQIATLLRLNGLTDDFHDFLFSPVLGGEFGRMQEKV